MERHFCDGHTETWWAADAHLGGYGPDSPCRRVVATTDPAGLPEEVTWYLATNLPHPDAPHATTGSHPSADLAEIVRLYGLRPWVEQSYKQVKDELGWADVPPAPTALLAQGLTSHPFLAHPRHHPEPMVASLDGQGPTPRPSGPDRRGYHRTWHRPLLPDLSNYR
ncbi:hypothetical protein ACFVT5_14710 [Streptomyces sp. NPDC058001]|uniref:hypothetical protein n=1 Tax=Streptomyces sp. NPDC058001 TaxID=3346300 RepID=UPI0036EE09BB